jgi:hypothetical protein
MSIRRIAWIALLSLAIGAVPIVVHAQSSLPQDNATISVTTGLTYQSIAPADNTRQMIEIENNNLSGTDTCYINVDGLVAVGATTSTPVTTKNGATTAGKASVQLSPGGSYTRYYPYVPSGPIVGTCAQAADSIYAGIH